MKVQRKIDVEDGLGFQVNTKQGGINEQQKEKTKNVEEEG